MWQLLTKELSPLAPIAAVIIVATIQFIVSPLLKWMLSAFTAGRLQSLTRQLEFLTLYLKTYQEMPAAFKAPASPEGVFRWEALFPYQLDRVFAEFEVLYPSSEEIYQKPFKVSGLRKYFGLYWPKNSKPRIMVMLLWLILVVDWLVSLLLYFCVLFPNSARQFLSLSQSFGTWRLWLILAGATSIFTVLRVFFQEGAAECHYREISESSFSLASQAMHLSKAKRES